ncbi:hypothetical protein BC826DRAFT_228756 [Russula brevipes]|nr:hypothetical protein BC826DRAFT_228756 [Russula brevipes]
MSFFSLLFCCLRPRRHFLPNEPDENTPLIPASDDVQCVASDYPILYLTDVSPSRPAARHIVDPQRMKERLGVIVRAKEGKMVNVNAPLPFNLNNNSANNSKSRVGRLRTRSPQPSLDTERQSVVSSASAAASHELDEDMRWPTLNVRIVRGGSSLARGRPITRDAVMHERRAEGAEAGAGARAEEPSAEAQSGVVGGAGDALRIPSTAFKIQDVGSLSRSWGD